MIREIEGRQNHTIKLAHKLQKKRFRRERGLLVCEGLDLLELACDSGALITDVLVRADLLGSLPRALVEGAAAGPPDVGVCGEELIASVSSLGGAADVVFVCQQLSSSLSDLDLQTGIVVYLDEVGDPGNVGTLVRACAAFGASGMVCSPGTADPYGPKAMRAGMGAQFLTPVVVGVSPSDLLARLESLRQHGGEPVAILVADSRGGADVRDVLVETPDRGYLLVLGGERQGPGEAWAGCRRVCISQQRFDSLNVAMAGTVLLYELSRARYGDGVV
jgi:TrmH family RNA methyltransferase